jgi:hypothetical protein
MKLGRGLLRLGRNGERNMMHDALSERPGALLHIRFVEEVDEFSRPAAVD